MRKIYSGLLYLLAPLLPLYLIKRSFKNPDYRLGWSERFGINLVNPAKKPIIWLHAVSVGETRAMHKLVELINQYLPEYQILITSMTPTGRKTAQQLYPYALVHYIPYDISFCVKRFYAIFKPKLGIILETEIWPNLVHFAASNHMPLYLVNARLSERSYSGYKRFIRVLLPILQCFNGILCQDQGSAANFTALGYTGKLPVMGNTKFDLVVNNEVLELINQFKTKFIGRKVICFASTREGEEKLLLEQIEFKEDFLYLIIPRHPERFTEVATLCKSQGLKVQMRSEPKKIAQETQIVIGDSMGEMLAYYAISWLTIIGGSFRDCGGQNPLEALFMGVPVIFGPSMYNFSEVAVNSLASSCAMQVDTFSAADRLIHTLANDPKQYQDYAANAQQFIANYQGASQRIFNLICADNQLLAD